MKHMLRLCLAASLFLPVLLCGGCAPFSLLRTGVPSAVPALTQPTAQATVSPGAPRPGIRC